MQVEITIKLGNETMQSRQDIANAIRNVADQFLKNGKNYYPIMDANGNKVGEFNLADE